MSYSWGDDSGDSGGGGWSVPASHSDDYHDAREAYKEPPKPKSHCSSSDSSSGRSESGESVRRDHDFSSARGKTPAPIDRKTLAVKTESTHPIVVCADHTGSFKTEIGIILEKLPLLGKEVKRYMPPYEICFTLIGDSGCDAYPLEVQDFDKDEALDGHIKDLFPEGGGGDNPESYDLAAYYFTHHCNMPKAVKPIFIWILDSNTRDVLCGSHIRKVIGDDVQSDLNSRETLAKLKDRFTVYVILKGSEYKHFWADIYGEQAIVSLREPRDIVELIIGIIAGEAGKFEDFEHRSSKRHGDKPERMSRVGKALKSVKEKSDDIVEEEKGKSKASAKSKKGDDTGKPMKSKKLV